MGGGDRGSGGDDDAGAGVLDRLRSGPGTRAVLGGVLVAVAVVVVLAAGRGGDDVAPVRDALVAARDLPAGTVVELGDLAVAEVTLPTELEVVVFADPDDVVGRRTLSPVGRSELISASQLGDPSDIVGTRRYEVAVAASADRAVDGRLRPGESVTIVATFGTGGTAEGRVIAEGVEVAMVRRPGDGSFDADVTVTLATDDASVATAVASAADAGRLRLVREVVGGPTADAGSERP